MSVSTTNAFGSLISPIATPATAALIGTPASIIAIEPPLGERVEGLRNLEDGYIPPVFELWKGREILDRKRIVRPRESIEMTRRLVRECGIFAGISSGGALHVALRIAAEVENTGKPVALMRSEEIPPMVDQIRFFATAARHLEGGKQLSLSLLYWLQTACPRPDGGTGWKGLRLRPDIVGTEDGLAKYPYIRESRRIRAESGFDLGFAVAAHAVLREDRLHDP